MKILFIGDVVGNAGCSFLQDHLGGIKHSRGIDIVIANGENSASGNGMLPASAKFLLSNGVDVVTGGNHSFKRREIYDYLDKDVPVIRPANYPEAVPGKGMYIIDSGKYRIAVINLIGLVYIEPNSCPFKTADKLISEAGTNIIIVDFHAEATGEKGAMAYYLDGRVSAIAGTHTHVQTSDEQILPQGTGFITDAGMTGPIQSVLGVKPDSIIKMLTTHLPTKFEQDTGQCKLEGVIFDIDEKSGKCQAIERIRVV